MSFPKSIEDKLLERFDSLIAEGITLSAAMRKNHQIRRDELARSRIFAAGGNEMHSKEAELRSFTTRSESLIRQLFEGNPRLDTLLNKLYTTDSSSTVDEIRGILIGLKSDLEMGMLSSLYQQVETNIASDYMHQAEALLGEGISGKYDYVPAAVLSGAVLEKSLRELCSRQNPPIASVDTNGRPKTLDPLITDLQKVNVFSKAKADQLKSWAKIRNDAAHGEFTTFSRKDVEDMISGIKRFLAEYL